jgi:hypothetical protein
VAHAVGLLLLSAAAALAQDLEPRAYSASPIGTTFLVLAVGRSTGGVVFDPTLPVTDVEAKIGAATLGAGRTFDLGGRLALVTAALPYALGTMEGNVAEEARRITRSGLADVRVRLAVNIWGNPALTAREFARAPRRRVVGASLSAIAPSGQYDRHKLINLGGNRWAFKPEVGVSQPAGRWDLDAYLGVWLFTTNRQFYPADAERRQDAVIAVQGHASYRVGRRAWVALNYTYYRGGSTTVDDGAPSALQANTRLGATFALPLASGHSVKVALSTGAATRLGADFTTVTLAWQRVWF